MNIDYDNVKDINLHIMLQRKTSLKGELDK